MVDAIREFLAAVDKDKSLRCEKEKDRKGERDSAIFDTDIDY